jgi:DNA-binding transcriptional regulator YiaG
MPNFVQSIKNEIARLARKEIRSETLSMRKSSAQHRTEISELKRQATELKTEVKRLGKLYDYGISSQKSQDETVTRRFSAKSVIAQRKRLGISANDFGKLVGVSAVTIYAWEQGRSRPRKAQVKALGLVRALGKKQARAMLGGR